jgi:small subunit ribosomal protein S16
LLLRIRLSRVGKKKQPAYRIIVADSRSPRDGSFLKIIGHYNPLTEPTTLVVKEDEAVLWLEKGAKPSDTAAKLLTRIGVMERAGRSPVRYQGKDVPAAPKKKAAGPGKPAEQPTTKVEAPAHVDAVETAAEDAPIEAAASAPEEEASAADVGAEEPQREIEPEATSEEPSQEPAENQE